MAANHDPSPGLRLLDLLDLLSRQEQPLALPEVVALCGWPKPTVHRMLGQLEAGGWLVREPDGRRYALATRTLRLGEAALSTSTRQGVRHAVLRQLVAEVGESCNLTTLSGADVVYLDRVEAAFPLRLDLQPGTRVPLHCSASGKLFLAAMPARQRQALIDSLPLHRPHPQPAGGAGSRAAAHPPRRPCRGRRRVRGRPGVRGRAGAGHGPATGALCPGVAGTQRPHGPEPGPATAAQAAGGRHGLGPHPGLNSGVGRWAQVTLV